MGEHASDLLLIGSILLLALGAHALGRRLHVPRVTLLLLVGALSGPQLLDLLPEQASDSFSLVTQMTLAMVGFLLGERMSVRELRHGGEAIIVSLMVTIATAVLVLVVAYLITGNLVASLLLGAIAPATDAAASLDVIRESEAEGPMTRLVWQVVAIDDAWCVILFSLLLVAAGQLTGNGEVGSVLHGIVEVGGSVLLGAALGLPMAWLTGRIRPGEPSLLEAAGFVFLAAGLAAMWSFSYLLTCMVLGMVVANFATHHTVPFRSIQGVADPFLAVFFFLAGYSLDWLALLALGGLGVGYVAARVAGRYLGGWVGAVMAGSDTAVRHRLGSCLMPQAGVALGLALVAVERIPEMDFILPLVIGSTVIFEIVGPPLTLAQLRRAGEIRTPS